MRGTTVRVGDAFCCVILQRDSVLPSPQLSKDKEAVYTFLDERNVSDKTKALLEARFAFASKAPVGKAKTGA